MDAHAGECRNIHELGAILTIADFKGSSDLPYNFVAV